MRLAAGERADRARGGRGRERNRERNRGRKRDGDHVSEDAASKALTAEGSEEIAAVAGAGADGRRQQRGQRGRASGKRQEMAHSEDVHKL